MCGIVTVLQRPSSRSAPPAAELTAALRTGLAALTGHPDDPDSLAAGAVALEAADASLRGVAGLRALLADPALMDAVDAAARQATDVAADLERRLDAGEVAVSGPVLELLNGGLIRLKDAAWALGRDRLGHARAVRELAGEGATDPAIAALSAVQVALASIDRLEVRGRDSAGLHILVTGHEVDLSAPDAAALIEDRTDDPLFISGAVRTPDGALSFVYKAAAEIGELGDNSAAIRRQLAGDQLLRRAISAPGALVTVLGHTRWASVGIISEANAHPLNSDEVGAPSPAPYVVAALNGDVDNYAELREADGLRIAAEITTDAKVIPALTSRRLAAGDDAAEAFRATVARFEGSVAIAAVTTAEPDKVLLALRGSGQALYVGLAEDSFVVASEPYGLIEETSSYLRMDGESDGPSGSRGQIVVLDRADAGTLEGVTRRAYDGTVLPVAATEVHRAEITTRDIDRGGFAHFLLKEMTEAPESFRKTLRGKVIDGRHGPEVLLDDEMFPPAIRAGLVSGEIRRVVAAGQGTAAVAAQALAATLTETCGGRLSVSASSVAELSGFGLDDDMSDTLLVAISQSGTTTDTNRTVDMVRARGGRVIAIVNRRNSDLVEKADGVLYTSDGRDIEMAVPSTKAFYSQVAAGFLLAQSIASALGTLDRARAAEVAAALRRLPAAMTEVLTRRDVIAEAAHRVALPRRHWAIVGNGPNRVAAQEIRIKLSELCYKSIGFDTTEEKKHIDLCAEPLILVCAAGLSGPIADDVAKEVAIYRAHKGAPVVIASDGDRRFDDADAVLSVPAVDEAVDFVLSTLAGHLFGYEAALAIDAQARVLREARGHIDIALEAGQPESLLDRLRQPLAAPAAAFFGGLRSGLYNDLEVGAAVRLASLLRYATGLIPLDVFEVEHGKLASPSVVVADLLDALNEAIDELTRTIDVIKHQAKTVTVGISRSEDELFSAPLVAAVLAAGAGRDEIGYRALRTLAVLDGAVAEVLGFTRYRIEGSVADGSATLEVTDQGGVAVGLPSRTATDPRLLGTKHRAVEEREVTVSVGRRDGRHVIHVSEAKDNQPTGLTLLHVRLHDRLTPEAAKTVLRGYRGRYSAIVDAVTEAEPTFDDAVLGEIDLVELLTEPVYALARRWGTQ